MDFPNVYERVASIFFFSVRFWAHMPNSSTKLAYLLNQVIPVIVVRA